MTYNLNCVGVNNEELLKVTGYNAHYKNGDISEMKQDRDDVTTCQPVR